MTKDEFMNKVYRLQNLQQILVGVIDLTFKVTTYFTRDNYAAVEWMLLRGEEWSKSGTIIECDDNDEASKKIADLKDYITEHGWI